MPNGILQEYIHLKNAKRERNELEDILDNNVNYNNEWIAPNDEYMQIIDRLVVLYKTIGEIRQYLFNVSPSYREKFPEHHQIDSVISVF